MIKNWLCCVILLLFLLSCFSFCTSYQDLLNTIKFGTKEKKLAEVKKITQFSKKEVEQIFELIISEPENEVLAELISQIRLVLPPDYVLPKILPLLTQPLTKENQRLIEEIKNYIMFHKNNNFVFNFIQENIMSGEANLQQKFYLINYLDIFSIDLVLPIVKNVYNKQDLLRLAVAKVLSSYKDKETKEILVSYLFDEIAEIQLQAVKSLIERQEWDTIPQILVLTKSKLFGEEVLKLVEQINNIDASHHFFLAIPLFTEPKIKKLCIIQAAKFKNINYLSTFIQLYKTEKNEELREVLKNVIEKYDVPSADTVFISYIYDKDLFDITIPMLIKLKSANALPYIIDVYIHLPEHLKVLIEETLPEYNNEKLTYYLVQKLETRNVRLRCLILKSLSSVDNMIVYNTLKHETETTKNKIIIKTLISSLARIKNYDKQVEIIKLLIKKCYTDTDLLLQLLEQLNTIVSKTEYKHSIFFPELIMLLRHKNENVVRRSLEVLKIIIKSSSIEEIRILYRLLSPSTDNVKKLVVKILLSYPDNEFLSFATEFYHTSKDIELKKLLVEYVINVTSSPSYEIILESLRSKNKDLQLHTLKLCKGKVKYEEVQHFLPLCYSKNDEIRKTVVNVISDVLTEKERNYILNFLKDNIDEIKIVGIELYAKLLPEEFINLAADFLRSKNIRISQLVLKKLQKFQPKDRTLINVIKEIAVYSTDVDLRREAIITLATWKNSDQETIKIYFDAIHSPENKLRSAAEFAFDMILPVCETIEDIYLKGIVSENYTVKNYFVKKIIELKPQYVSIKHRLKNLVLTANDESLRNSYFSALASIITDNDINLLTELYNSNIIALKLQVVKLVQNFTSSIDAENIILTALKDSSPTVRQQAVESLQNFIKSKKVYEALMYVSQYDTNYSVRTTAEKILNIYKHK